MVYKLYPCLDNILGKRLNKIRRVAKQTGMKIKSISYEEIPHLNLVTVVTLENKPCPRKKVKN